MFESWNVVACGCWVCLAWNLAAWGCWTGTGLGKLIEVGGWGWTTCLAEACWYLLACSCSCTNCLYSLWGACLWNLELLSLPNFCRLASEPTKSTGIKGRSYFAYNYCIKHLIQLITKEFLTIIAYLSKKIPATKIAKCNFIVGVAWKKNFC